MSANLPTSYKIANQDNTRRLVIPDIHGCIKSFEGIINKINLQKSDQLFLLGDYIDRGPSSSSVLDLILDLQKEDYSIFPLRGNHEQMLLDAAKHSSEELMGHAHMYNVTDLLNDNQVKDDYLNFLDSLPYYYELDNFYLVHAGFNFRAANPFEDYDAMLWIRGFVPDNHRLKGKKVIHGHDPVTMEEIRHSIDNGQLKVPLDNGCVHSGLRPGMGNLLCLNLDTFVLEVQENIDY